MSETRVGTDSHLPVKPAIAIFSLILLAVAVVASIAGENQKIKVTGRKLMTFVADRKYQDAYDKLLTEDAQKRISPEDFRAKLAVLRTYLRLDYGPAAWCSQLDERRDRRCGRAIPGLCDQPRTVPASDADASGRGG